MAKSRNLDFRRKLARQIEPTGGPGALLETLEDAARSIGLMKPWRQARPYWDHCAGEILKAAETGERAHIVEATRCLEVALQLVATMPHGSYSLGEAAAKLQMVRPTCPKCGRARQFRIARLLEHYGPDIATPDLRHELAQCPRPRDNVRPAPNRICRSVGGFLTASWQPSAIRPAVTRRRMRRRYSAQMVKSQNTGA